MTSKKHVEEAEVEAASPPPVGFAAVLVEDAGDEEPIPALVTSRAWERVQLEVVLDLSPFSLLFNLFMKDIFNDSQLQLVSESNLSWKRSVLDGLINIIC